MTDDLTPQFRETAAERITPRPGETIADGLIAADPLPRRPRRRAALWALGSAIVVLSLALGGLGFAIANNGTAPEAAPEAADVPEVIPFPDDTFATAAPAGPCTTVTVLSSFENAAMVESLAAGYAAKPRDVNGQCVSIVTAKEKSGVAADAAAENFGAQTEDVRPTIWMPDGSSWIASARAEGSLVVPDGGVSAGSSDIVLAMPEPLADAIGWSTTPPEWNDVFVAAEDHQLWASFGHPEWGAFKLGKTSPLVATSGQAALLASFGASGGGVGTTTVADFTDQQIVDEVKRHELATSHYMATPEHFLWHAREAEAAGSATDFLSAVIVDEKSVWDYNRGITSRDGVTRVQADPPLVPLVPIYPSDGVYSADNPSVILDGSWVDETERLAAEDFLRFIGTVDGQQLVRDSGYRDLHGELSAEVMETARLQETVTGTLPLPGADVITALHDSFEVVRKRASVLFLIDVSGSMADPIPSGISKLDGAKAAITEALGHFTAGDDVGLAAFSSDGGTTVTPGLVTPVADIESQRDELVAAVDALSPQAFTPLFAAVDQFAAQQAASYDPDRINAVVVLSDGANDPGALTLTEDQMLANLGALHHHSPVLVFTLAYGAAADVESLRRISSATGAHFYDATDPTKVSAVLGDLVTSF